MPAAAAISCSRSPSGPLRAISSCAVSRISRRASSGVRRSRFTEAGIEDHRHILTLLSATPILKRSHPTMGTSPMSQPTDTRLHPIAAYRAVRKLMQHREHHQKAALLIDALGSETMLSHVAHFANTDR